MQKRLVEWEARGSQSVDKIVLGVIRAAANELHEAGNEEPELVEDVEHPYILEEI